MLAPTMCNETPRQTGIGTTRCRIGRSEMRCPYHPTISPESVSRHRPPNTLRFIGELVNHLCVGRGHDPADPLQFLTQFLVCYRRFFAKQEPFRISEVIGGVMTPPYEVLRNSPTNGSLNLQPRERIGQSKMRNDTHPTVSLEIVSGHCPQKAPIPAGIGAFFSQKDP